MDLEKEIMNIIKNDDCFLKPKLQGFRKKRKLKIFDYDDEEDDIDESRHCSCSSGCKREKVQHFNYDLKSILTIEESVIDWSIASQGQSIASQYNQSDITEHNKLNIDMRTEIELVKDLTAFEKKTLY